MLMTPPVRLFLLTGLVASTLNVVRAQPGVSLGMIGIAAGQTARAKALNLGNDESPATSSCSVTIQFLDSESQHIKKKVVTLRAGKAAWLDLKSSELPSSNDLRTEIRAVLLFGYSGGASPLPAILQKYDCNIVAGLEIYDSSTGKSSLILTDAKPIPVAAQQ